MEKSLLTTCYRIRKALNPGLPGQAWVGTACWDHCATMQALCKYPGVWTTGIAESGVSDMQAMFNETHKFESQYLQPLCFEADISPEDAKRIIEERNPIHWTQNIKVSILILSREVDEIVPPNQAHLIAEKVQEGAAQ
jgi:dipeptidyl aminopeptidase/acylaminoacyl peptidase